jgi:hypothetical protein
MKEADDNIIIPFKGRSIDETKEIKVYRNLHKTGKWYSIKQDNLVVGHAKRLCLSKPRFLINQSGKQRAIKEQQRNVHALIIGYLRKSGMGTTAAGNLKVKIKYDPFKPYGFYNDNLTINRLEIKSAEFCIINENGVSAAYLGKTKIIK